MRQLILLFLGLMSAISQAQIKQWPPSLGHTNDAPRVSKRLLTRELTGSEIVSQQTGGGGISTGTAFYIGRGYFVTNAHVVRNCRWLSLGEHQQTASLVAKDKQQDLAVLRSERVPKIQAILSDRALAQLGEDILVVGYPLWGLLEKINITTGTVSAEGGVSSEPRRFQISAPIQPGNSGGPVLDKYGEVVGVVVAQINDKFMRENLGVATQNINFAIPLTELKQFLDDHRIPFATGPAKPEDRSAVVKKARAYTVLVTCH